MADEIERTVARGVVVPEQKTDFYVKSTVLRPMTDAEKLATGLEFLTTASEIPLMLRKAQASFGDRPVKWLPERPGTQREEVLIAPIENVDEMNVESAAELLLAIIKEAADLGLQLPEVA